MSVVAEPVEAHNPEPVELDDMAVLVEDLRVATGERMRWAKREDELKAAIQGALGERETGTVNGEPVVAWRWHLRHAFDQKAFKERHREIYRDFLVTSRYRIFSLYDDGDPS